MCLPRTLLVLSIFSILALLAPSKATADCKIWDDLQAARKSADDTAAAFNKVVIPEDLEKRIEGKIARILLENPGMSMKSALQQAQDELTIAEKAQLGPWLTARALRDAADAEYDRANKVYTDEYNLKENALKEAQAAFEAEQQWLEAEKQAIQNMPRDNTYLDRVEQITKRLRAAYEKMRADLARFRDCFPDVRRFLDDKEDRLQKIDLVDQEIARRRGIKPNNPNDPNTGDANAGKPDEKVPALAGEPEPPGALGDVYVCDGPIVSGIKAKLTSVDATGFTYEREVDGQKVAGGIKISKAPPLRVRGNQRVEIVMSAFGDVKATVDGSWDLNNVIAGQIPSDNGCSNIPHFKGVGDSSTATVRFYFGCGENAYIRMYGGEYDSRDGTRMEIVWKYHKEGGN